MKTTRDFPLDFIRAAAAVSVIAVHFFLNSGFYDVPASSLPRAGIFLRTQFMVCVPLFLLLTGYLQRSKTWNRSYYRGLGSLLLTYVLASVLCGVFRAAFLGGTWSPVQWLQEILSFSLAPYGWYIELYIGLFLLVPFLNTAWNALPSRRVKLLLVLTTVFLSIFPSLNTISLYFGWQAIPERWAALYPVAYYFTGCYLRESLPKIRWPLLLLVDVLAVLAGGSLHIIQAGEEPFGFFPITYWNGILTYCATLCVFLLLKKGTFSHFPHLLKKGVSLIASLSLPIFLLSWIPDQIAYTTLGSAIPQVADRLPWICVTVPFVLVCSVVMAWLLNKVQTLLRAAFQKWLPKKPSLEGHARNDRQS